MSFYDRVYEIDPEFRTFSKYIVPLLIGSVRRCNLARQKEEDRDFIVSMQPQNSAGNWLHGCCEKRRIVSKSCAGMQHAENHIRIIGFWHESSCVTASLVTLRYYYACTAWLFFFLSLDWYPVCSRVNIWWSESMCGQPRQLNLIVLIEVKRPRLLLHTELWMWWSDLLQNITWYFSFRFAT